MKSFYTLLVAGMLAMAIVLPAAQARTFVPVHAPAKVTITDALAHQILVQMVGDFEAQLHRTLTTEILFKEYKEGRVSIQYLDFDGVVHLFSVTHEDGGTGIAVIEDF